jgi:hypothetical protein
MVLGQERLSRVRPPRHAGRPVRRHPQAPADGNRVRRQRGEDEADEEEDDRTEDSGQGGGTKSKDFASESVGREKTGQREEAAGRKEGRAAEDRRPRSGVTFGAQKASV